MPKMTFTETSITTLKQQPKTTWYSHKGDKYPGLFLAVGQKAKTWYLKKRNPTTGKTQTVTLGRFPAMSLDIAHKRAQNLSSEIHNGTRGSTKMDTLSDAFEYHCKTKVAAGQLSEDTVRSYRSIMKQMDDFMGRRLENISHIALQEHLSSMSPPTARLVRSIVRAAYRTAKKQRRTLDNPAEGIDLAPALRRETVTDIKELKAVWNEVEAIKSETKRMAWHVALFTGIRHNSVTTLRWEKDPLGQAGHVDLDERTIHLPKMKNRLARTLPISTPVVDAFKRQLGKDAIFVFPSDVKEGVPLYSMGRLKTAIVHDTRGHFATAGGMCELPSYIIAFLKGDKINADGHKMVAHYLGSVGSHAHVESIAEQIQHLTR